MVTYRSNDHFAYKKLVFVKASFASTIIAANATITVGITAIANTAVAKSITFAIIVVDASVIISIVFVANFIAVAFAMLHTAVDQMHCLQLGHLFILEMYLIYSCFSNRPNVEQGSSFSFPSFFYGCRSRACSYIP